MYATANTTHKAPPLSDAQFFFVIDLVQNTSGIQLDPAKKRDLVSNRLMRRLRAINLHTYEEYLDYLKTSADELIAFTNAITTNHTFFFREEHHFEHLADYVQTRWQRYDKNQPFRIWSSASSSGRNLIVWPWYYIKTSPMFASTT